MDNYAQTRKNTPIFSGVIKYFPRAIKEIAKVSFIGNEQHHPGEELWWDKTKSTDEADALVRHLTDHAQGIIYDTDGTLHLGKVAWRSLALLERYLENEENQKMDKLRTL